MKRLLSSSLIACLWLFFAIPMLAQLQEPVPPINLIIDSDMSENVDDVGDHAVLWALQNRGGVNVIALISDSALDYSAPAMRAIANYYGHPEVPVGAHKGSTPDQELSNTSVYAQQITNEFGTPGDTRFNYPDAVTVYRQALANAADHSVYIINTGYFQPMRDLLKSQPDSISPLTGMQLVSQKVKRFVCVGGVFPTGSEHDFRVDADAVSYVFANWPGEIVSVGTEVGGDVPTGPSPASDPTQDPVMRAYQLFANFYGRADLTMYAWGQVGLLYAIRGLGSNFVVQGFNGQTSIQDSTGPSPGNDVWLPAPQVGHSYVEKRISAFEMQAILNPLLQGSSNLPILRSISPTSVPAGSPGQSITLSGSNFFNDSQVFFNGASRPTTFISRNQLSVQLSSTDLAQPGNATLNILNSAEGGWRSNTMNLNIVSTVPVLTSISPSNALAGSGPITLTATGSGFVNSSRIQVNGTNRNTTFISSTQLTTVLTTADLAVAGSLSITVTTPGAGVSGALTFTVSNPVPSLTSISPASVTAGSAGFTLTLNGSNFVPGSLAQVNGSNRATTFVSATQLTAAISASDVAVGALLSITVVNPAPGGGASAAVTLTVNNPVPSISSISPNPVVATSGSFTLTVNGSGFVQGSVVQYDGTPRPTTFVSPTQLTAQIRSTDLLIGQHSITVFNPAPGGGTSNSATLTVISLFGQMMPSTQWLSTAADALLESFVSAGM